eukprot:CAMPEP_0177295702 /NCGR_PEP_ID=MMETSP0368-20130122/2017_1 /TAXON_ID=447022 ORGANISM="Scrippsiella hangoei-like, Strain SHHI-4" /NCGR_SAMPLE_ID=MMETSP0368 /ASSEMBLY_ACC=CAM_ASM_000363 /LENGTH=878 /DNA_ID=CAMNT_0018753753 /DNA_START=49 /DNA_END=2685 /DNA_ORIENTATION=-
MANDLAGPLGNLDYRVAHGSNKGPAANPPTFLVVRNAGTGEADGVYKPGDRRWLDHDVYQNRYGDCIVSREGQKSAKTGDVKHGFVLGKEGSPLYGVKTERLAVPSKGWKAFQGCEPVPEILLFSTWSEACQHAAWYFAQEAENAAKGSHWKVVLMMADRAFDCHTNARPKGRGDSRNGGSEWSTQLCELLGLRADALLHLGQYKRALVDACAAVHFVAAFDWSKAKTRGVTACLNLGVEEEQAKLLIDDMSKRSDRDFLGIKCLELVVDMMLHRAKEGQLKTVELEDETPDDGRIYFRVVDPEDCKLHAGPDRGTKVLGSRNFNDIVRGQQIIKNGDWLELHVSEEYDDSIGHRKAYIPIYSQGLDGEEREEILDRMKPREYPRRSQWERMGLTLKPVGIKPPAEMHCPPDYCRWRDPDRPVNQKEWPFIYKHGLAVATMVRGVPDFVLDSFVRYHWITGWNHVFLFFDDPEDPALSHAKQLGDLCLTKKVEGIGISVIKMDSQWWETAASSSRFFLRRDKNDAYASVCKMHEKHQNVASRQMIAFDLAILSAHEMGIDWFAHIDIDECIYVPKFLDNSARRYLGSRERGVQCVRLWNHEAVPESMECQDWFRECTLFQVNKYHCQGFKAPREYDQLLRKREGREFEAEKASSDTKWWNKVMATIHLKRQAAVRRLKLELPSPPSGTIPDLDGITVPVGNEHHHETFVSFCAYTCGRSIVRLDKNVRPPIPWGLHSFLADNGDPLKYEQAVSGGDPVILHYPNASFSQWKEKYERLGEVDPKHGITLEGVGSPPRAHLASSQLVLHRPRHQQELFYRTCIMQTEHNELALMAEHGLVLRIEGVRELLEFYDQPREAPEVLPGQMELRDLQTGIKFGR